MKRILRLISVLLAVVSVVFWLASGAHMGWSKSLVPRTTLDEVTGLERVTYEKRFVPGLDFLVVTVSAALFLAGVSFLRPRKKQTATSNPNHERSPNAT